LDLGSSGIFDRDLVPVFAHALVSAVRLQSTSPIEKET